MTEKRQEESVAYCVSWARVSRRSEPCSCSVLQQTLLMIIRKTLNEQQKNLSKGLRYVEESRKHATDKDRKIDQYDINFTARTSFAETG